MTEYILANLRTGRRILNVPVMSGPWDDRLGAAETINVTVDMNDPDVQALDLRNSGTPGQSALCVNEGGVLMAGGPVWVSDYDRDNKALTLNALGMASMLDHRLIMPLIAQTLGIDQWTVPDPNDPTKTIANPLLATIIDGFSLGTIAKRWLQQALTFAGGNLPIVFQSDEAGTATQPVDGVDFKRIGEGFSQLSGRENGPEINLKPRYTADKLGVEWLLETGTAAQPLITSSAVLAWNVTAPESPISGLRIKKDASKLGSLAWQTGGRKADTVLVARSYDSALVDSGYPLMELTDTSHSSVEIQSTLDTYANADTAAGKRSVEVWSFTAKARPYDQHGKPAGPFVGQYAVGDYVDLIFAEKIDGRLPLGALLPSDDVFPSEELFPADGTPWSSHGDPFIPGGTYRQRIIGISGDATGIDIQIQCAPRLAD